MLSLREYRNKADRLADFLPWAALVAPGVVLNKDGSFQRTSRFRGPDLDSATPAELVATTARLNSALRRLGSGWSIFVEAVRRPALDYPVCAFPDPASALVERERAAQFAEEGAHFESESEYEYDGEEEREARGSRGRRRRGTVDGLDP